MRVNNNFFHKMSLFVLVMSLVEVPSTAFSSNDVFDSSTNNQWAQDMCADNTTCVDTAKKCFTQLRRARWFLESLESLNSDSDAPASLAKRCQRKRDNFDVCAAAANLNATWSSITGTDQSCQPSFLRRQPPFHRPHLHHDFRRRRRTPPYFGTLFSLPGRGYSERFGNPFRRNVRDLGRRGPRRGGWRGPRRLFQDHKRGRGLVVAFLDSLELTNSAAFQNFTDCTLKQEDLLTDGGDVNRDTFNILTSVAFAAESQVLADVRDAVTTCPEPTLPLLEDYMKCWATVCVEAKLA